MKAYQALAIAAVAAQGLSDVAHAEKCDYSEIGPKLYPLGPMVAKCLAATGYNLARPPVPPTDTQVAAICKKCPDFIEAVSKLTFPDCTMVIAGTDQTFTAFFDSITVPCKTGGAPTSAPTVAPTSAPTTAPTTAPTSAPTTAPTTAPSTTTPASSSAAPTTKPVSTSSAPTKEPQTQATSAPPAASTTPSSTSKSNGNGSSSSSTEIEAPVVDSASSSDGGATGSITTPKPASTSASLPTKAPASSGVLAAVSTGAVFAASIASFLL
ncbi:hypothetical protein PINS_up003900 [Pythium insidiosum]|nr:hypothetical protein PINS_up003900 [Pythium insidiosum]